MNFLPGFAHIRDFCKRIDARNVASFVMSKLDFCACCICCLYLLPAFSGVSQFGIFPLGWLGSPKFSHTHGAAHGSHSFLTLRSIFPLSPGGVGVLHPLTAYGLCGVNSPISVRNTCPPEGAPTKPLLTGSNISRRPVKLKLHAPEGEAIRVEVTDEDNVGLTSWRQSTQTEHP